METLKKHRLALAVWLCIGIIIGVIAFKPLKEAQFENRLTQVMDIAGEKFRERDAAELEASFRENTGLSDIRCEYSIEPAYGNHPDLLHYSYNEKENTYYCRCIPTIYSKEIDKYYTHDLRSEKAEKLYSIMRSLQQSRYNNKHYFYDTYYGKVNLEVDFQSVFNSVMIHSPAGHKYEIKEYDSNGMKVVEVDEKLAYLWTAPSKSTSAGSQKAGNSTNSSSYKSKGSSSKKSSKKTSPGREIDPDDYDIEGYYDDNRDIYEDYEDAWEGFLDDEDAWEDY